MPALAVFGTNTCVNQLSGLGGIVSSGIRCFSSSQSPRSIILQRSLQNGLHLYFSFHSIVLPQVGHLGEAILVMVLYSAAGQLKLDVLTDFRSPVLGVNFKEAYSKLVSAAADFG